MRIGILETGFPPRELQEAHGTYPDMFAKLLGGHGFEFQAWPVLKDVFPQGPHDADGWLITGSRFGVYDDEPWIARAMDLVREIAAAKVPLVGICFGHQLMAHALGGRAAKSDKGWGLGPVDYRDLESGETMRIIAVHQDQVLEQPPRTRIIAENDFCPIAGLAWEDTPAISWQPHPEMSPAFTTGLIEMRRGLTYDDALADAALGRMDQPLTSPALGQRIARFFEENAKVDA